MLFNHKTFICFEGADGSGKTTLMRSVIDKLHELGETNFVELVEPGCKTLPELDAVLRPILRDPDLDPVTEVLLHQAYRRENVNKTIQPALDAGISVISDRFSLSTWCMNVYPFKEDLPHLADLFMGTSPYVFGEGLQEPLTFLLDVDAETRMERLKASGKSLDRYESDPEYFAKVSEAYAELAENPSIITLDGTMSTDELADLVIKTVRDYNNKQTEKIAELRERLNSDEPEPTSEESAGDATEELVEELAGEKISLEELVYAYVERTLQTLKLIESQSGEVPVENEFEQYRDFIYDVVTTILKGVENPLQSMQTEDDLKGLDNQIIPTIIYKRRYEQWTTNLEHMKTPKSDSAE